MTVLNTRTRERHAAPTRGKSMRQTTALALWMTAAALAQTGPDMPTGPRMTPPTLNVVTPLGISRGTTTELTLEGLNLAGSSAIYFSESGIKGRIVRVKELPDLP